MRMGLQSTILRFFPKYRRLEQKLSEKSRGRQDRKPVTIQEAPAPRYLVAKSSTVGIGNRMLFLAGCLFLCRETGRRLVVDWRDGMFGAMEENAFWSYFEESDGIHIREFQFLEDAPATDFSPPEWAGHLPLEIRACYRRLHQSGGREGAPPPPSVGGEDAPPPGKVTGEMLSKTGWKYHGFFDARPERILVTYGGKSRLTEFPPKRLHAQFPGLDAEGVIGHLLRTELRPGPELRRRRDEFVAAQFTGRRVLGVHLRNTDKTPTRPIEELLAQAVGLAGEEMAVFLATDHEPTQELFRGALGERLLVLPKWFDPQAAALHYSRSADAAQKRAMGFEALLDMYLLARCDQLFLQKNSTFSRIAAYLSSLSPADVHWHSDDVTVAWEP